MLVAKAVASPCEISKLDLLKILYINSPRIKSGVQSQMKLNMRFCNFFILFSKIKGCLNLNPDQLAPKKLRGFFPEPCPVGFTDIDPGSLFEYETGNCIKILPENSYEKNKLECESLNGTLAVPLSVQHNRKIAETGLTRDNKNEINIRKLWLGITGKGFKNFKLEHSKNNREYYV